MADSRKKRGRADRALIAVKQPHEVAYWSKKFRTTPAKLKAAVKVAGRSSKKVEAYLKLQKRKDRDRALISTREPWEVAYWAKTFRVTAARLKSAVKEVGRSSQRVGAYLGVASRKKAKKRKTARKKK
jgi:hypothetical protein